MTIAGMPVTLSSLSSANRAYLLFAVLALFNVLTPFVVICQPDWVRRRPFSPNYFVGIGVADKQAVSDAFQAAKAAALNDLASEISVSISGETVRTMSEQTGLYVDEVRSFIHAATKADLEGYELVDTYEDDHYWVYYRLSKDLYQQQRDARIQSSIMLSTDLIRRSEDALKRNEPVHALQLMLQALRAIEKQLGEPLKAVVGTSDVFISNHIYAEMQGLLQRVSFVPSDIQLRSKKGMTADASSSFVVEFSVNATDGTVPMPLLPLKINEVNGDHPSPSEFLTDQSGHFRLPPLRGKGAAKRSQFIVQPDLLALAGTDTISLILTAFLSRLTLPSARVTINAEDVRVALLSFEKNLGKALSIPLIEPKVKSYLGKNGFVFVTDQDQADLVITIEADTRPGAQVYGQFSSFAIANLSVLDGKTRTEVYKNSIQDAKGIHVDYNKAGLKSLEDACTRIVENLLPELVNIVSR